MHTENPRLAKFRAILNGENWNDFPDTSLMRARMVRGVQKFSFVKRTRCVCLKSLLVDTKWIGAGPIGYRPQVCMAAKEVSFKFIFAAAVIGTPSSRSK